MQTNFDEEFEYLWQTVEPATIPPVKEEEVDDTTTYPFLHWQQTQAPTESRVRGIATELSRIMGFDINTFTPEQRSGLHDLIVVTLFLGSRR